jgi:hypothetical protein
MGTFIWLTIATVCGCFIGAHWFDAALIGSIIGFAIGLLIRFAPGELFGGLLDGIGG